MKYCVCQNGNRISVKRGDRDYDFGMVLCRCDTYEEAKNSALYFRMAKLNGGEKNNVQGDLFSNNALCVKKDSESGTSTS